MFPRPFCNQCYQRLVSSAIPIYLALWFSVKWRVPRWSTFPCPPSLHRVVNLIYLQLLRGKCFQTEVIIRSIAKVPMPCKVKNIAKCPRLLCAKSLLEENAGVNRVHASWPLDLSVPLSLNSSVLASPLVGWALLLHTS